MAIATNVKQSWARSKTYRIVLSSAEAIAGSVDLLIDSSLSGRVLVETVQIKTAAGIIRIEGASSIYSTGTGILTIAEGITNFVTGDVISVRTNLLN